MQVSEETRPKIALENKIEKLSSFEMRGRRRTSDGRVLGRERAVSRGENWTRVRRGMVEENHEKYCVRWGLKIGTRYQTREPACDPNRPDSNACRDSQWNCNPSPHGDRPAHDSIPQRVRTRAWGA